MLLRLLRLGLLSLLFVHQTTPALSIIEESVKELIVERRTGYFDLFSVKMKTDRTCDLATCTSLGAQRVHSFCHCQCGSYQPYTFLSSIQRCANTTQVQDFGGELGIHQTALSLCCSHFSQIKQHVRSLYFARRMALSKGLGNWVNQISGQFSQYNDP